MAGILAVFVLEVTFLASAQDLLACSFEVNHNASAFGDNDFALLMQSADDPEQLAQMLENDGYSPEEAQQFTIAINQSACEFIGRERSCIERFHLFIKHDPSFYSTDVSCIYPKKLQYADL